MSFLTNRVVAVGIVKINTYPDKYLMTFVMIHLIHDTIYSFLNHDSIQSGGFNIASFKDNINFVPWEFLATSINSACSTETYSKDMFIRNLSRMASSNDPQYMLA